MTETRLATIEAPKSRVRLPAASAPTRRLDTRIKLPACRDAGVPEVWHADPQARTLVVYGLSEDGTTYIELARGGEGDMVASRLLPGLQIEVSRIFPR